MYIKDIHLVFVTIFLKLAQALVTCLYFIFVRGQQDSLLFHQKDRHPLPHHHHLHHPKESMSKMQSNHLRF